MDQARARYFDIYDLAPVGYLIVSEKGIVMESNLTAATLLGVSRINLVKQRLSQHIHKEDMDIYYFHRKKLFETMEPEECELRILRNDGTSFWGHMKATIVTEEGLPVCRLILSNISARKEAEFALMESQSILKAAFENSQAGIAIADAPDGKLRYVNKAGLLIRGKSEEEIVKGIDVHNYVAAWKMLHFDGTPLAEDEAPLARAVLYGETCSDEFIIGRDDSEDRYVLANAAPIKDSNNNIMAGILVFLDITNRKKTEIQLQQKMKDLLGSQRIAHIGTWRLDLATSQVVWSEELYRMFGFDPANPPPPYTEQMKLFVPESWDKLSAAMEITRTSGIPYELELETVKEDGSNGWMRTYGEAEKVSEGNISTLWGAAQDITEFKKLENERTKFFLLAESSSEFIGMCDLDMNPLYVNPAGRSLVGLPDVATACHVKVQDYYFPEDQRFIAEEFFPRVLRDGDGGVEIRLRHFQTGEAIWMYYYLFSVNNESGTPVGWATVSRDITAHKQTLEALRKSEERFRVAQEMSPDGFTILTPVRNETGEIIDFSWVYENQAIARITQTVPEKVIGKRLLDLFPGHSGTTVFKAYKHVANTGESKEPLINDLNK